MAQRAAGAESTVEPPGPAHDRLDFSRGVPELDAYLQRRARQDMERKLAAVFVLTADGRTIAGFRTLSAHSILGADLPEAQRAKLPRFPLPVTLLGRMAVSRGLHGRGLGELLLMRALERAWMGSRELACWAVAVDAKAGAQEFYRKFDFLAFAFAPEPVVFTHEDDRTIVRAVRFARRAEVLGRRFVSGG